MGYLEKFGTTADSVTRWPDDPAARAALKDMFAKMAVNETIPILNGDGKHFRGADLSGLHLRTADLVNSTLDGVNFSGAKLGDAWFHRASAQGTVFDGANLRDAQFRETNLTGAFFRGADLADAEFSDCVFTGVTFQRATLEYIMMSDSDLQGVDLSDCAFGSKYGAGFEHVRLFGATVTNAHGVVRGPIDVGEHHPELLAGAELAQWFSDHGAPGVTVA